MSEDWEKDFDLDMTEEEVQLALSKADATAEVLLREAVSAQAHAHPLQLWCVKQ